MAFSAQLVAVLALLALGAAQSSNRFPDDFLFGASSASYQVEGAWDEDGKGENIWDHVLHMRPNFTVDFQNGDVAADSYHLYREDVKALREMGMDFYRFSISWARILPTGEGSRVNQAGVDYYNNLINELLDNGIQPMVTMYHWDLPQWLQDLGGWANPILADYFEDYARVLYENFGDRVKWWITFNEPDETIKGYAQEDGQAPAVNKSGVGDYLAAHTILLSHGRAYHLYDQQYRARQQGKVGMSFNSDWIEPLTNSSDDAAAADRAMQFHLGIFAHPIHSREGDYPAVVRERVDANSKAEGRTRSRLPVFSQESVDYIRGTGDFFGLNHYSTLLSTSGEAGLNPSIGRDTGSINSQNASWPGGASSWLKVVPWGFRKLINWIDKEYDAPTIIVTENGFSDRGELDDTGRINYHTSYLAELLKAINEDGCKVAGYAAWSVIDNLEWTVGYTERFGLYHVNFSDPARPRTAKASAKVMGDIVRNREIPEEYLQR